MKAGSNRKHVVGIACVLVMTPLAAAADSGFYVGGSAGGATLEANIGDTGIPGLPASLDEDDTAYKFFLGYTLDLPVVYFAAEAGYVDFGKPEINVLSEQITLDTTGFNMWGIAGIEAGPLDLFAKLGYIAWEVDVSGLDGRISDDGYDPGYGLGLSFGLGPVSVRGEYEVYDLDDADVSMLSVGVVYQFD
jgi:hypothetical protein